MRPGQGAVLSIISKGRAVGGEGAAKHRGSILASHPAALGLILAVPKIRGQRLDNVKRTHLILARNKLVLQKGRRVDLSNKKIRGPWFDSSRLSKN